jgi:hydroxymethylglutaryl-CoA lyase
VVEENEEFVVTRAGNTVKIILNRPQKGNKLTVSMLEGLKRTFTKLAEDPTVFHIVISAKGKYFCTGMDLSGKTEVSGVSQENSYFSKVVALYEAIENSPQTTIALVQGPCFGGGVGLTFACDIRLASATARWTLSEIKLGLSPAIISKLMSREWGIPFFREAILTGREVTPEELLRIGAVHQVVEDETTLDQLLESYLSVLSGCAPHSATACKALVLAAWADAGGQKQSKLIKDTFDAMTAPGSEGEYGMQQFQKKVKKTDWGTYWATKASTNLLKQT